MVFYTDVVYYSGVLINFWTYVMSDGVSNFLVSLGPVYCIFVPWVCVLYFDDEFVDYGLRSKMGITRSPLSQNNGNLSLLFFCGNNPIYFI